MKNTASLLAPMTTGIFRTCIVYSVFLMTHFATACADLVSMQDNSITVPPGYGWVTGSGNITSDTSSGLSWIDVTLTSALSFNQVTAQLGTRGYYPGYRYATNAELIGFWNSAGIITPNLNQYEDSARISNLINMWGPTHNNYPEGTRLYTSVFTGDRIGLNPGLGSLRAQPGLDWAAISYDNNWGSDFGSILIGSALVRNTSEITGVPEPSSLSIACCIMMGGVGLWYRRRRKAHTRRNERVSF